MYACVCPPSCALLLFAFAAAARPRHRFQTSLRDRSLADLTAPVCALPLPRRHWLGQSYLPASPLPLAPGLERRPGQTTSPAASPTTVSCIVANRPGP